MPTCSAREGPKSRPSDLLRAGNGGVDIALPPPPGHGFDAGPDLAL
jgi:hypothetical protein